VANVVDYPSVPRIRATAVPAPEVIEACNLCGGRELVPFRQQVGLKTGLLFTYVRCRACGLKFVSPRLDAQQKTPP
jgi:hypothetical protein